MKYLHKEIVNVIVPADGYSKINSVANRSLVVFRLKRHTHLKAPFKVENEPHSGERERDIATGKICTNDLLLATRIYIT